MESSESPEDPAGAGLRAPRPAAQELTTRGRKRTSAALTTAHGVPAARDRSKSLVIDFKRLRAQPPAEGGVFRDRSNHRDLNFKRPRALPKRRRRNKRVLTKGNAPPPARESAGGKATPTPTSAPPTPFYSPPTLHLAPPTHTLSKAWADYDEEDDRRVYEEDPSTLFSDSPSSSPAPPLTSPALTLSRPLTCSSSHPSLLTPQPSPTPPLTSPTPPLAPPLTGRTLSSEEQVEAPLCLLSSVEEDDAADRLVSPRGFLRKQTEKVVEFFPGTRLLFEPFCDVKVICILFSGDQREMREETERLCLGKIMPQRLLSKHGSGLSLTAFRKLKKRMSEMIKLHITGDIGLDLFLLSFKDSHTSAALFTLSTFYQSSGSRRGRSVEERNTRKWLRHVHTRRAAVTQGRSRRKLKSIGNKLCSPFSHRSGLLLKPADTVPHNSA